MSLFSQRPFFFLSWTLALASSGLLVSGARAQDVAVSSPNSRIRAFISPSATGLSYSVRVGGQTAIEPSPLGISVDGQNLGQGAVLGRPRERQFKETYPVTGVHATALNSFREAIFPVRSGTANWQLEVRVFDDGVAMRYRVPETGQHTVNGETSGWKVPEGSVTWYQTDTGAYERPYQEQQVERIAPDATIAAPLTVKLPRGLGYAFLSEANLVNYSDMSLHVAGDRSFVASFVNNRDGWKTDSEIVSPWRVTMLAPDLNGLVNSDLLRNLCPPPAPELASATWIRPGRSSWHYLVVARPQWETQKQWVDWTQQLGFDYYLIDEGWDKWNFNGKDQWGCMKEVVDYARQRNVQIWAWLHSREVFDPQARLAYFEKARAAGVVGLKIDFPQRPNVDWVNWYDETARDAARYHLMLDFHGADKPTGRERTWPNELTREAVFGQEQGGLPILHITALPFTRMVQGHADFTPTDFRPDRLHGSSWAHELARAIVYTSPFLCYGGSPQNYLQNPALDILKSVPSTWDETRVLPDSEIGRTAAFARRRGDTWFVGIINGDEDRPFKINLGFLGKGRFRADLLSDSSEQNDAFVRTSRVVSSRDSLPCDVRRDGGYVARFTPITP